MERTIVHIVGGDSRSRAEQARVAFALGHHAEVYSDLDELLERPPNLGVVTVGDDGTPGFARWTVERVAASGICLPIVFASTAPSTGQVVAAIRAGGLDYLDLPLEMGGFARRLEAIVAEAAEHGAKLRRQANARRAVEALSPREGEVLYLLSSGCSNKEIARALSISPRTVEIHRGNMMTKLGAGRAADAVRLWIDARAGGASVPAIRRHEEREAEDIVVGRIGGRLADEPIPQPGRRQRQ